jgi:predicted DNA-binding transcriptional regulator AlpA
MGTDVSQIDGSGSEARPLGLRKLLTVGELYAIFGVSPSWVYKSTQKGAEHPLPVYRLSGRAIRFDPSQISAYLLTRTRRSSATLTRRKTTRAAQWIV